MGVSSANERYWELVGLPAHQRLPPALGIYAPLLSGHRDGAGFGGVAYFRAYRLGVDGGRGSRGPHVALFLFGILSGAITDRWDRRLLLRIGNLGASAAALVMALLLLLGGLANVWVVVVLVGALGSMFAFTLTVRQTYTFDIVGSGLSFERAGPRSDGHARRWHRRVPRFWGVD